MCGGGGGTILAIRTFSKRGGEEVQGKVRERLKLTGAPLKSPDAATPGAGELPEEAAAKALSLPLGDDLGRVTGDRHGSRGSGRRHARGHLREGVAAPNESPVETSLPVGKRSVGGRKRKERALDELFEGSQGELAHARSGGSSSRRASSVCEICGSGEVPPELRCRLCQVAVHSQCYDCEAVSGWTCEPCQQGVPLGQGACVLCPSRGGALKRTKKGLWVHSVCCLWCEHTYTNEQGLIEGIPQIPKEVAGACIVCSAKGCRVAFHVLCNRRKGLPVLILDSGAGNLVYKAYCENHQEVY
eukprot:jgi/Mesen1/4195/ME000219S03318